MEKGRRANTRRCVRSIEHVEETCHCDGALEHSFSTCSYSVAPIKTSLESKGNDDRANAEHRTAVLGWGQERKRGSDTGQVVIRC